MMRQIVRYLPFLQEFIYLMLKNGVDLRMAAVYGSAVSGEMSPTSDMDMKIFVGNRRDIKVAKQLEKEINEKIAKSGSNNFVHAMVFVRPSPEHLGGGILLFGNPIVTTARKEELLEGRMITYDTTRIDKNRTAKLSIRLFGQTLKRKVGRKLKVYAKEGIVKAHGGKPLRNAILVDRKGAEKIAKILEEFGIPYKTSTVYAERFADFIER